jgi:hypothetical protein
MMNRIIKKVAASFLAPPCPVAVYRFRVAACTVRGACVFKFGTFDI